MSTRREFHFSEGTSNKFWAIELDGSRFFVEFGRLGTAGQKQIKEFGSAAEAEKAARKLVMEKVKKGYLEVGGAGAKAEKGGSKAKPAKAPAASKGGATATSAVLSLVKAAKRRPGAAPVEEGGGADRAARAPGSSTTGAAGARRGGGGKPSIDLDPGDWQWASWRPRKALPRPPVPAFDVAEAAGRLARISAGSYGYRWAWEDAGLSPTLSREEAHFWFAAMSGESREQKPRALAAELAKKRWDGKVSEKEISSKLKKMKKSAELLIPLGTFLGPDRIVAWMLAEKDFGDWDSLDKLLPGFRAYVLPYLDEKELAAIRKACRPHLSPKAWPKDPYERPHNAFFLAAFVGGLEKELAAVVGSWRDGLYSDKGEDWFDHYHKPQYVVLGLGSAAEVEREMRRLKLELKEPEMVRAWLAHTELGALDYVEHSVLARKNKDEAEELLRVLALCRAPEAARHMLALKLSSRAPAVAREWLDENPEHAAAGLLPLVAERGKLAEAAVEQLREMKRVGLGAPIEAAAARLRGEAAAKARALVLEHEEKVYEPLDAKRAPAPLARALASAAKLRWREVAFVPPAGSLPPIVVGGRRLDDAQVQATLAALQGSSLDAPHELVAALREHADRDSRDAFAWKLFELWMGEGSPSKERWMLGAVGCLGGDAAALKLTPLVRAWPGESQHQRAVFGLDCLRAIGTDTALMQLNGIAQKLKFKALKQRAMEAMELIAKGRKMTRSQLEDRIVPDCDLDEKGGRTFDFGGRTFRMVLGPQMKPMIRDEEGKLKPDLPKPGQKDDAAKAAAAVAEWKLLKKQVQEVAKIQAVRLEQSMVTGRRWSVEEFETLLVKHPLMTNLVRLVVWGGYDKAGALAGTFRVTEEQTFTDDADRAVAISRYASVGIVHPLDLDEGARGRWGQLFSDYELLSPFAQLGRPVHSLEKGEDKQKELTRFKGPKIPAVSVVGTLEKLGWTRGVPQDGGVFFEHSKPFYGANVTAVVEYDGIPVGGYMVEWDDQQIQRCFFVPGIYTPEGYPDHKKALPLGKVDRVAVSEVLADLTLLATKGK